MNKSKFEDILFNPNIVLKEVLETSKEVHVTKLVCEGVTLAIRVITSNGTTYA